MGIDENCDPQYFFSKKLIVRKLLSGAVICTPPIKKNPRKLTPRECARLQGFPENFIVNAVSDGQAYKQFGNSVCVAVIRAIANQMINAISIANALKIEGKKTIKINKLTNRKQLDLFPG